jgi:hypothetical protein
MLNLHQFANGIIEAIWNRKNKNLIGTNFLALQEKIYLELDNPKALLNLILMTLDTQNKIAGIIAEMQGIEEQLANMTNWKDDVGEYMRFQFQDMKRELFKEFMIELINANVDFSDLNETFSHFLSNPKSEKLSPEDKLRLQEVERLMAVA